MSDKKSINVARPFNLTLKSGQPPIKIAAGVQSVDPEIADHWYTKQHLANGGHGTAEYAAAARASADETFLKALAARNEYEVLEEAAGDAEEAAGLERSEPAFRRLMPKPDLDDGEGAGKDDGDDKADAPKPAKAKRTKAGEKAADGDKTDKAVDAEQPVETKVDDGEGAAETTKEA